MKSFKKTLFLFFVAINFCQAQDTIVLLTPKMFEDNQQIYLSKREGWIYKPGNNIEISNIEADTKGWIKKSPFELTVNDADKNGKVEGWFKIKFKLDTAFDTIPLGIRKGSWAAMDVYIDGKHFQSYGNTGSKGQFYEESNPWNLFPTPVNFISGRVYTLTIHIVDYRSSITPWELKSLTHSNCLRLTGPKYLTFLTNRISNILFYRTLSLGICSVIFLFFMVFLYQNPKEKNLKMYTFVIFIFTLYSITEFFYESPLTTNSFERISSGFLSNILFLSIIALMLLIASIILKNKKYKIILWIFVLLIMIDVFESLRISYPNNINYFIITIATLLALFTILFSIYLIISSLKNLKGSQRIILIALFFIFILSAMSIIEANLNNEKWNQLLYITLFTTFFPICLLIHVSTRFKETKKEVEEKALALSKNIENLKSTQSQLIQSEKMASLGELTAGIAHEIQNPLNFVNNFSEVSTELLDEMDEELDKGAIEEAKAIAANIKQNLEKINYHGKRADRIVKGMLQHSRSGSLVKEPTDINKLADEYLRLAYHGLRAKDKSFNADLLTDFNPSLPKASVLAQDIGRVLLNLFTNAFYATHQMQKLSGEAYKPVVSITTSQIDDCIEIKVKDNGIGIPDAIKDKILQPFFTTKPTGEGTGLGLSLSYDIIVKGHNGKILIESKEKEYTVFTIQIPIN